MGSMEHVFSLTDVSVSRGDQQILKGINWQASEGQHWVVLGSNGAGKTTLAKVLTGRMQVSGGSVEMLGEDLGDYPSSELGRLIGFTSAALTSRFGTRQSAFDVVLSAAAGQTTRYQGDFEEVDFQRARDLLDVFGVSHLADRKFASLSEGEKQRVQIARAFMADPQILLLDEPGAGLDLGARETLLAALTELATDRRAPAMVVITHHLEEIPSGFTHALLLRDGQVQSSGTLDSVMTDQNLSAAYGLPLTVGSDAGRWWAHGRS